jgi:hypothetical protein
MRCATIFFVLLNILVSRANAQSETQKRSYSNFPVVITLQFHSLAMPFNNFKGNFSNVGIGVGTEVSYNRKQSFTQQVQAVWYCNRTVGNGLLIFTQPSWRPALYKSLFGEVKAGVGYLYSFRPVDSYQQVNGEWVSVGHKGKGMLTIPLAVSLGYNSAFENISIAPFVSYQFMVMSGYNKSIPIVPQTFVQVGSRIHMK